VTPREIAKGQSAHLVLDGHGRWTARVEAIDGTRVAVAALARLPGDHAVLSGAQARIAVTTPRGLVHVTGIVLAADRSGLLEVELTAEPQVDQRRHHVRVPARVPGVVGPRDPSTGQPLHTFTIDVSGGGLLVAGAGPVEPGAPVAVTVKLPDREPLTSDGRIARVTETGHVALRFDGIADEQREELVRWIFERQRLERAAAREGR
jgi:c-di-GMP-binding flagellar brake protein YcgR